MFKKLLIANRGEIAVRILRACRELSVPAAVVFSDVDRASLHVRLADEAYPIGPAPSRESYLRIDKLMEIAGRAGCDALHPGYGFLAENPELAKACAANGITFVGPSATAMEKLGSKTAARQLARQAGVPMVPGVFDAVRDDQQAIEIAEEIGYPVVLKAVAGGGGKGMRVIVSAAELASGWRDASSEALNAFGDARLYIEKYLQRPKHIEIQVVADSHGSVVYLGERECSVQRRHQKVIEESPSCVVDPALRRAMGEAAVRLARAAGYVNAGTAEFLVDDQRNFYFLEVNTRLQVEHPVTEAITGIDLVKLQIQIAAGQPLPFSQDVIAARGHAIECRIYAEDPDNNFFPSPGKITSWRAPTGPGIRLDEGVYAGWTVPADYDPLLGKLIAWGSDRGEAIARLRRALQEFDLRGIKSNIGLFAAILDDEEFVRGDIHTRWLDEHIPELQRILRNGDSRPQQEDLSARDAAAIAAGVWFMKQSKAQATPKVNAAPAWRLQARRDQVASGLENE